MIFVSWTTQRSLLLATAVSISAFTMAACEQADSQGQADKPSLKAEGQTTIVIREEAPAEPTPPSCSNCGEVVAVTAVSVKGESSGAGAAMGAVIGGVIGHQIGSGSGNDAATAGGAVGGAIAGNEIERNNNARTEFDVTVAFDDGGTRIVRMASLGSVNTGDRVRVAGDSVIEIN